MHAGSFTIRARARGPRRVRFRVERAEQIAERYGLITIQQKAAFFDVTETTYSRVVRGKIRPGEEFIAAVAGSHPEDPDVSFNNLFEVVAA